METIMTDMMLVALAYAAWFCNAYCFIKC